MAKGVEILLGFTLLQTYEENDDALELLEVSLARASVVRRSYNLAGRQHRRQGYLQDIAQVQDSERRFRCPSTD